MLKSKRISLESFCLFVESNKGGEKGYMFARSPSLSFLHDSCNECYVPEAMGVPIFAWSAMFMDNMNAYEFSNIGK